MANAQPQYAQLAQRLGVARRAYKRTGAFAGAIVFLIEALGTIAIVVAADVLFDLAPAGRIALFVIGASALAVFAFRHIVRPLLQPITDQQLALYLEQRNPQFEGSLIAATEFGPQSYSGRVAEIVESILDQAIVRAGKFDLRKAIDFARLRKYGVVALVLIGIYLVAAVTMPQAVSRRFARVLTPWKPVPQDVEQIAQAPKVLAPLTISLNLGDTSLVRGGTLSLQADANRRPNQSVNFHFRSLAAGGEWKRVGMSETDQLNTYALTLPDINEDLEYFVSAENTKSDPHRVSVYDPLLIKSFEVVTKFPSYLRFADRVETPGTPDVSAPAGSNVSIRAITNGQLKSGKFASVDSTEVPTTIIGENQPAASWSMAVTRDEIFTLSLTDIHGQTVTTPTPSTLTCIIDRPPTVKLTSPAMQVTSNPMGEIAFVADIADDLALENADLVVTRGVDPAAKPTRYPLTVTGETPDGLGMTSARAAGTLMLETLSPKLVPGELLMAYVETKDRKGQTMPSDLVQITVVTYESWAVFSPEQHEGGPLVTYPLEPVLHAAWRLYSTSGQMAPLELNKQAEELAAAMVNAKGALLPYFDPTDVTDPVKLDHGAKAMKLAHAGRDALLRHDMADAVAQLRAAVAELVAAGVVDVVVITKPPPGGTAQSSELEKVVTKMTALVDQTPTGGASPEARSEKDAAADAAKQMEKAAELEKSAANLAEKLTKAAEMKDGGEKKAAPEAEKLATQAADAAKATKDAAGTDAAKQAAAQDIADAAKNLKDAAEAGKTGKADEAAAKAGAAQRQLASAKAKLTGASQENVDKSLDKAEELAAAAARKQGELIERTEAADKAAAPQKKDAAGSVATEQVKLTKDIKELAGAIDGLNKAGAAGAVKADTAKQVQKANDDLKKGRLEQKIANAAIKLAAGDIKGAQAEQQKIKDVLETVGDSLKNAGGTRAGDVATALKRAKDDAAAAKANLDKLGKEAGVEARKELADKTADELARLARALQQRDLSNGNKEFTADAEAIGTAVKNLAKLSDELEKVPAKRGSLAKITTRVQEHLEAEYQTTLKSKELFAAQREECPPEYRPLVNKYFEAIATDAK